MATRTAFGEITIVDVSDGTSGTSPGRLINIEAYRTTPDASQPDAPTASIQWSNNLITLNPPDWVLEAPTYDANATTVYWKVPISFSDPEGTAATTSGNVGNVIRGINFDGLVSFTALAAGGVGPGGGTTFIEGGHINTDSIVVDRLTITGGIINKTGALLDGLTIAQGGVQTVMVNSNAITQVVVGPNPTLTGTEAGSEILFFMTSQYEFSNSVFEAPIEFHTLTVLIDDSLGNIGFAETNGSTFLLVYIDPIFGSTEEFSSQTSLTVIGSGISRGGDVVGVASGVSVFGDSPLVLMELKR